METRILSVETRERRIVGPLIALFFCLAFGYQMGQTAAYALFVARFGRGSIPLAFLVIPVVGAVLTIANTILVGRISIRHVLALELATLVAVGAVVRVGTGQGIGAVIFVLPAWDAATNSLNNMIVWTTAGRLLDLRESKRLGAVIIAGRSAGQVIAGLAVRPIVGFIGTSNLFLVEVAAFVAAGGVLAYIIRVHSTQLTTLPPIRTVPRPTGQTDGSSRNRAYVRGIGVLVFLTMVGYVMVRNIFLDRTAVEFPTPEGYASTIGLVSAVQGLAVLIASLLFAGRFMSRFGIRGALIAFPAGMFAIYLPFVALGFGGGSDLLLFAVAAVGYSVGGVLMYGLRTPTLQVLYQLVQPSTRDRVRAAADGIIEPTAIGVAALLLLFVTRVLHGDATGFAVGLILVAGMLLATAPDLARRYRMSLKGAVRGHLFNGAVVDLNDPATIEDITRIIESEDAQSVVSLIEILDDDTCGSIAPRLLGHPDPEVRAIAIDRLRDPDVVLAITLAEADPQPTVRAAAIERLGQRLPRAVLVGAATDPAPVVRAAVLPILRSPEADPELRMLGRSVLQELADSSDPEHRRIAARLIERGKVPDDIQDQLARDGDPSVRNTVLIARCRSGDPTAVAEVVASLDLRHGADRTDDPTGSQTSGRASVLVNVASRTTNSSESTRSAIVAAGDAAVGPLLSLLGRPDLPTPSRSRAIRCISNIGSDRARAALASCIDAADAPMRGEALVAFESINGTFTTAEKVRLLEVELTAALDDLQWCQAIAVRCSASSTADEAERSVGLVALELFRKRVALARERALLIAGCGSHRNTLRRVRRLVDTSHPQQAFAVELLDVSVDAEIRRRLLPLVLGDIREPGEMTAALVAVTGSRPVPNATFRSATAVHQVPVGFFRLALSHIVCPNGAQTEGSMSMIERLIVLKNVEVFTGLAPSLLVDIAHLLDEVRLRPDQELFAQGDPGSDMYVVVEGTIAIHQDNAIVDRSGPFAVLGELALLDGEPRSASATAETEALLYRLSAELFFELMVEHPEVLRSILRTVIGRLRARMHDVAVLREQLSLAGTER